MEGGEGNETLPLLQQIPFRSWGNLKALQCGQTTVRSPMSVTLMKLAGS